MSTAIRLYGTKQSVATAAASSVFVEPDETYFELEEAYEISQSRAAGEITNVIIEDDRYVELVFNDGSTWFGDNNNLKEIFPELKEQSRSAADAPILPGSLASDDASRSLVGDIALKLFRKFIKTKVKQGIKAVAAKIEEQVRFGAGYFYFGCFVGSKYKIWQQRKKPFIYFIISTL